ncbi:MAG: 6-bladed beta-propeller, partial [Tannerella sp.]|nr:6-bladed beta-propeller [Tannerella sp.]
MEDSLIILEDNYPAVSDTISVSRFVDSLFYIPLGATNGDKIDEVQKVMMTGRYIFVHNVMEGLYMFTREGAFLRKITGECWGFDVQEAAERIYVACRNRIQVYDFSGNIIHARIPLDKETTGIGNFIAAIDTGKIAVSVWNRGVETNRLVIMKTDGSIVRAFPNHEKFRSLRTPVVSASRFHRTLFRYHDEIRYHPYYSDTLFSLSGERLEPVFVEHKIFKVPQAHRLEYLGDSQAFESYCIENDACATRFLETSRFMLVVYNMGRIFRTLPNYLLYDKQTAELYNYRQYMHFRNGRYHFGLFNDYDGGLPFNPEFTSGEYLIEACNAARFIRDYTNGREMMDCNKDSTVCTIRHYDIRSDRYP